MPRGEPGRGAEGISGRRRLEAGRGQVCDGAGTPGRALRCPHGLGAVTYRRYRLVAGGAQRGWACCRFAESGSQLAVNERRAEAAEALVVF